MPVIELAEKTILSSWIQRTPKSSRQLNDIFSSDCELIVLDNERTLALTTDTISEEISLGLYQDPFTMGWISATASLSDLAAVGANPLGTLFSTCFGEHVTDSFQRQISLGFCEALNTAQTYLLGGDSSRGSESVLTSTGVGICDSRPITRIGAKVGDALVLTGKNGIGPALAYGLLLNIDGSAQELEKWYRPTIDPSAKLKLAQHSSAMIDTSDGILSAVTTLCALNNVGAKLHWNPEVLEEEAIAFCVKHQIPLWSLWVAEHGDYQLLSVIPREKVHQLPTNQCHVIGEIAERKIFELHFGERNQSIDPSWGQLVALTHRSKYSARCRALLNEFRELDFP